MKEYFANIGKKAYIHAAEFTICVEILDVKVAYGSVRYQVTPTDSMNFGTAWLNAENVNIDSALNSGAPVEAS